MARNISNLTIRLSLLSTTGGLFNTKDTASERETSLKMLCPVCEASLLDQRYHCQSGCLPDAAHPGAAADGWSRGEVDTRAIMQGKKPVRVDPAAIEAAKEAALTTPKGEFELLPVHASQLEAETGIGSTCYTFVPDKGDEVYALLLEAAAKPDVALIGVINLRSNEKLYRLETHQGTLRVQELLRPEETASFAPIGTVPVAKANKAMFDQVLDALTDDFEADNYASTKLAGLRTVIAAATGGTPLAPAAVTAPVKAAQGTDALLQAALAMAKSKKPKAAGKAKKTA